jgi:hypothetical protein
MMLMMLDIFEDPCTTQSLFVCHQGSHATEDMPAFGRCDTCPCHYADYKNSLEFRRWNMQSLLWMLMTVCGRSSHLDKSSFRIQPNASLTEVLCHGAKLLLQGAC